MDQAERNELESVVVEEFENDIVVYQTLYKALTGLHDDPNNGVIAAQLMLGRSVENLRSTIKYIDAAAQRKREAA